MPDPALRALRKDLEHAVEELELLRGGAPDAGLEVAGALQRAAKALTEVEQAIRDVIAALGLTRRTFRSQQVEQARQKLEELLG